MTLQGRSNAKVKTGVIPALALMIVLTTACSGDSGAVDGPILLEANLDGEYDYTFSMTTDSLSLRPDLVIDCQSVGTVALEEVEDPPGTGENGFTGTLDLEVMCDGPGGELMESGTSEITDGTTNQGTFVTALLIEYSFSLQHIRCLAAGTGTPVNSVAPAGVLQGGAVCQVDLNDRDDVDWSNPNNELAQVIGDWEAVRRE